MSRAVAADEARAIDRERHRQILQRDVVDQLIVRALQERRIDRDDRPQAFARHAGARSVTACCSAIATSK